MKELSLSESTFHRNRAGAAYSIVRRLESLGLIHRDTDSHNISVSKLGESTLRAWLKPPIPLDDIAHTADFLRLRFFFLELLSPEDRQVFIVSALGSLLEMIDRSLELVDLNLAMGDKMGALATLSFLHETQARMAWLKDVEWLSQNLDRASDADIRRIAQSIKSSCGMMRYTNDVKGS